MGFSCKSKSAIAVCNSTSTASSSSHRNNNNNGTFLESFRFRDLETATNWFSRDNLILKTSHGHLYRANLTDGRVVTVKRPDTSQRSHEEAFDNEVQILSKLFSRRLVNLLGCSRDGRVKLLVLEYMDNGSLHENLTEPVVSLSWPMRVKLSVDIAKAVRALHASSPPIVHSNLRSTNVFLDSDGCARLGDFCLAKVLPEQVEPPRRSNLISIPETATDEDYGRRSSAGLNDDLDDVDDKSSESRIISPKLDVHSFGILLLEIMSGQTRSEDHPRGLLDWALPLIKHGHFMAICEPRITPFPDSAAMRIMATMAARCVSSRRPAMEEVVQCLVKASKLVPEPLWTNSTTTSNTSTISTPLYPELTPSTSTSRELKAQITTRQTRSNSTSRPTSRYREMLVNSNLDVGHTPFNATSTPSTLVFPNPTKKMTTTKRTLVFRLGRFVVRKLKIARRGSSSYGSSYDKIPVGKKAKSLSSRSPRTATTKVSDDLDFREMTVVEELDHGLRYEKKPEPKKTRNLDKASRSTATGGKSSRFTAFYSSSINHRSGKKFARL